MQPVLKAFALACAFLGGGHSLADETPLVVAGAIIPQVFEPGKPGPYSNFYDELFADAPVRHTLVMLPVKRLARAFFEKEAHCMYMSTDDDTFYERHGVKKTSLLHSMPFNRIFMKAYGRFNASNAPASWVALEGKLIAGDEGIHVSSIAQRKIPFAKEILYTKTIDEAFELLAANRVDVALAYSIDAREYFKRSGRNDFRADGAFVLFALGEGVTCWPSEEGQQLITHVNARISKMQSDGSLKSIFGFEVR